MPRRMMEGWRIRILVRSQSLHQLQFGSTECTDRKFILIFHQRVMQQVSVDLYTPSQPPAISPRSPRQRPNALLWPQFWNGMAGLAHLRLDQDEVDEQHDKVVLDVLVAEAPAVLADRQPDVVAARLVAAALAPERLDGVSALNADRHGGVISRARAQATAGYG